MSHIKADLAGLSSVQSPDAVRAASQAQRPAHGETAPGPARGRRHGASMCDSAMVLPLGGGMSPSRILGTG
jgi:hypothetical protein